MALAVTIYLQAPCMIVSGYSGGEDVTIVGGANLQKGIIEQSYMGSEWEYLVGNVVTFNLDGAITINDGDDEYFLITEDKIIYFEDFPT